MFLVASTDATQAAPKGPAQPGQDGREWSAAQLGALDYPPATGGGQAGAVPDESRAPLAAFRTAGNPVADRSANEPFPYVFVGVVGDEGAQRKIVLERNSSIFLVGRGDVLARAYRIRAINRDGVDVFFVSTQTRRLIPFSEISPPANRNEVAAADSQSLASENAVIQLTDSGRQREPASLEALMGLRPPGEEMETWAPSARGGMVALPPSDDDVQDHPGK